MRIVTNDSVCTDDYEASELGAYLNDCAGGDERAFEEVGGRGNLRLRIDDRREVVSAQALRDVGALRVLADGDEDRRPGIVA